MIAYSIMAVIYKKTALTVYDLSIHFMNISWRIMNQICIQINRIGAKLSFILFYIIYYFILIDHVPF